jgi:hypothetical protein
VPWTSLRTPMIPLFRTTFLHYGLTNRKNNSKFLGGYDVLPICVCSYCAVLKQRVADMGVLVVTRDISVAFSPWFIRIWHMERIRRVRNFGLGSRWPCSWNLLPPRLAQAFCRGCGTVHWTTGIRSIIIFRLLTMGRREAHIEPNHVLLLRCCIISFSRWLSSRWKPLVIPSLSTAPCQSTRVRRAAYPLCFIKFIKIIAIWRDATIVCQLMGTRFPSLLFVLIHIVAPF